MHADTTGSLIVQTDFGWTFHAGDQRLEFTADTPPEQMVQSIGEVLSMLSPTMRRCVMVVDRREVMFTKFDLPQSLDANDRPAIGFELERHFPLDAEAMAFDYGFESDLRCVSAFAVQTDRFESLVDAIEDSSSGKMAIELIAIVAPAMLLAKGWQVGQQATISQRLLWVSDTHSEWMKISENGLSSWKHLPPVSSGSFQVVLAASTVDDARPEDALPENTLPENVQPKSWIVVGHASLNETGKNDLRGYLGDDVQFSERLPSDLVSLGVNELLAGRWGSWPNLRANRLAPKDPLYAIAGPLRWLAIAAALSLLIISLAAWFRGQRLADQIDQVRQQQRAVYQTTFPGRRVPIGLMRSVKLQHAKTLGSRGKDDSIDLPVAATDVLAALLRGLDQAARNEDARFRLIDASILDGECRLTLRVKDAVEIGRITKTLESVGFEVDLPASEQIPPSKIESLVTFQSTIVARWNPERALSAETAS